MSTQSPLTVIAPIRSDRLEILKSLLAEIDKKVESNDILPFGLLETVHFARFVIIDPINAKKPSCLAFSSNYDGALDDHLDDLYDHAGVGFDRVFSNCEGYNPNDKKQFKDYILSKKRPYPNAFYVGHRGLSVKAIRQQSKIRDTIQTF